jgi:hypothetical protein
MKLSFYNFMAWQNSKLTVNVVKGVFVFIERQI